MAWIRSTRARWIWTWTCRWWYRRRYGLGCGRRGRKSKKNQPPFRTYANEIKPSLQLLTHKRSWIAPSPSFTDWALSNQPEPNLLSKPLAHIQQQRPPSNTFSLFTVTGTNALPRISKFILVASFIASTNPPKSDMRMFGRGLDEKKSKKRIRRLGGGGRKVKADGTTTATMVKKILPSFI